MGSGHSPLAGLGSRPRSRGAAAPARWALLAVALLALPATARAGSLLGPGAASVSARQLTIVWVPPGKDPQASERPTRGQSCESLAASLTRGHGPWGLGAFDRVVCGPEPTSRAGKDQLEGAWVLSVEERPRLLTFTFYYLPPGRRRRKTAAPAQVAQVLAAELTEPAEFLKDPVYAALVAGALLDALPFAFAVPPEDLGEATQDVAVSEASSELGQRLPRKLRPSALRLFTLSFDNTTKLWEPDTVGQGKFLSGRRASRMRLHRRAAEHDNTRWVFGQRLEGTGTVQRQLLLAAQQRAEALLRHDDDAAASTLSDRVTDTLLRATLGNIGSGYLGIRYGRELIDPKTAILPPATLVGLVAEFRAGLLDGLRIYWDEIPKVTRSLGDDDIFYSSSRLLLGYGFGFRPPWLLDRLELAPKIGEWSVKARFPLQTATGQVAVLPFSSNHALSVGVDLSAEIEAPRYLVRAWGSRDGASSALGKGHANTVTAQRAGVDLLLKGPRLFTGSSSWNLSFLLFGFTETVTISRQAAPPAPGAAAVASEAQTLGTSTAYGGGGVSLAW